MACKLRRFNAVSIESLSDAQQVDLVRVINEAVGFEGMVGGRALDLAAGSGTGSRRAKHPWADRRTDWHPPKQARFAPMLDS